MDGNDNADRLSHLLGVKLRALVGEHLGNIEAIAGIDVSPFLGGVAFVHERRAWVLVDGVADRSLGAALAWTIRNAADELDLVAEHGTGLLARRASGFELPTRVWFAEERALLPAVAEPLPDSFEADPSHLALSNLIQSAGATPNVEHGVVTGEVRGLEVCRVVDEPTFGRLTDEYGAPLNASAGLVEADGDGGVILEVGVGANDREAFQLLHGHVPKVEALAEVVRSVGAHRAPGAPAHPLNRMAPERALRSDAIDDPSGLALTSLEPIAPPVPRPSMKNVAPCVAAGRSHDGEVTVVFSAGVDLDLAPFVAATNAMQVRERGSAPPVLVVLPERDQLPIARSLLDLLEHPVSVVDPGGGAR